MFLMPCCIQTVKARGARKHIDLSRLVTCHLYFYRPKHEIGMQSGKGDSVHLDTFLLLSLRALYNISL